MFPNARVFSPLAHSSFVFVGIYLVKRQTRGGAARYAPTPRRLQRQGPVGAILRAFKAAVTRRGRVEAGHLGPVWQRNYYEHIIRNDQEYLRARDYIARNAESWEIDKENPQQRR